MGTRTGFAASDRKEVARDAGHPVASRDLLSPIQSLADTVLFVLLGVATGFGYYHFVLHSPGTFRDFASMALAIALLFIGAERVLYARHPTRQTTGFDRLRDAAENWTLSFGALFFILFAMKSGAAASRGALISFYLLGLPIVGLWRVLVPPVLARTAHKAGTAGRECIVIGDVGDPALDDFSAELTEGGYPQPKVMKFRADCDPGAWPEELHRLVTETVRAARALRYGEVFVCSGTVPPERLISIERALSVLPRAIYVVPDAQVMHLVRCNPFPVGTHIALEVRREPLGSAARFVKRAMDIVLASIAVVFCSPFFLIIALAIKIDSRGPVFFRQTRLGYRGEPFRIFKFRTMSVLEDGPGVRQASRDDPRVTRVGRFLRRSSIDEVPQLFNVLMGEMSLVGPRPHPRSLDEYYARLIENYEVRQHVKPGVTGWAQVHGLRGETKDLDLMYGRIEFDLWYAINASLLLDCEILVRTVLEVFRRRNAY